MALPEWLRLHDRLAGRLAGVASGGGRAVLACALGETDAPPARPDPAVEPLGAWDHRAFALALADGADEAAARRSLLAAFGAAPDRRLGIACYPEHAGDPAELLLAAERAAREAPPGGCGEAQPRAGGRRPAAEPEALAEGRLTLHYQPQVALAGGGIRGLEALARIHRPEEAGAAQWVSGGTTALENLREILPWTFEQAQADIAGWRAAGLPVVPVAVNLPLADLEDPGLCDWIVGFLTRHPEAAEDFELELTEDLPPGNLAPVCANLERLKAAGLRLALDDVGTGFAGVSLLERLPLDVLKIDRLFVARLPDDTDAVESVRALVALGRAHGLLVVGEGVELPEQRQALAALGCDLYQGYGFSAPVSAEAIARLLRG